MDNLIVIVLVVVIVGLAGLYVYRAKKRGTKCIGCPGGCGGNCSGCACKGETE